MITNAATLSTTIVTLCAPSIPNARASSAVAVAVTRPSRKRTGTKRSSGSSRYAPSAPGRSLRSAMSRSDSRMSALNAASIAPRYTAAHASRKMASGIISYSRAQSSLRADRPCGAIAARAGACARDRVRDRSRPDGEGRGAPAREARSVGRCAGRARPAACATPRAITMSPRKSHKVEVRPEPAGRGWPARRENSETSVGRRRRPR